MMTDLLLIIGLCVLAAFFWQLRQMAETSRRYMDSEASKQRVQLLSVAMSSARPSIGGQTGLTWKANYQFEFSTDGMNNFQGQLTLLGNRVTHIKWPIFPEPEWSHAPTAKGSIGGGCGGGARSNSSCSSKGCASSCK